TLDARSPAPVRRSAGDAERLRGSDGAAVLVERLDPERLGALVHRNHGFEPGPGGPGDLRSPVAQHPTLSDLGGPVPTRVDDGPAAGFAGRAGGRIQRRADPRLDAGSVADVGAG